MARPRSAMTEEACEKILRAVRLGFPPDRAADAAGVNPATMRSHRRRDKAFATSIKSADAEAELGYMSRIIKHSETKWQASAWIMERRWPERWAQKVQQITEVDEASTDEFL